MSDWMDEDAAPLARDEQRVKAVQYAQNYLVFEQDPRARAILEHWTKTISRRRTPVAATVQEYAANEAARAFVDGIHDQIAFAHSQGNVFA